VIAMLFVTQGACRSDGGQAHRLKSPGLEALSADSDVAAYKTSQSRLRDERAGIDGYFSRIFAGSFQCHFSAGGSVDLIPRFLR
jgi:hypothetical protein